MIKELHCYIEVDQEQLLQSEIYQLHEFNINNAHAHATAYR